jgi:hypothetical protein
MLQFDPASATVSPRPDFYIIGTTTEKTFLRASGDAIGNRCGDISSGPVFGYSSALNFFSKEKDLSAFINDVALDGKGTKLILNPGTFVIDSSLNLAGTIPGGSFGVAIDPAGMTGYRVGPGGVEVLNLLTFLKTGSLQLGDTMTGAGTFGHGVGTMAISRDGALLAVITDHGLSLIETARLVPFAALASSVLLQFSPGTAPPRAFVVSGSFTLGPGSRGIDPLTQDVLLEVGAMALRIPAGSFHQQGQAFTFTGTIGGVSLAVELFAASATTGDYFAEASNANFTGSSLPLSLGWMIGGDAGRTLLVSGFAEVKSVP